MLRRILLSCLLLCCAGFVQAQVAVPALSGRVVDLTGALSAEAKQDLSARLEAIEKARGSQVAILLLPTVQPEDIEAFGIRVADAWKLGRKGVDDGAILIVALQDRRLRLEVGRGLEGAIPDAIAKRIIADTITPFFKQGDFHGGLAAGVNAIAEKIGAEALPPPETHGRSDEEELPIGFLIVAGFIVLVVLVVLGSIVSDRSSWYSSRGSRVLRHGGGFPLGGGWGGGSGGSSGGGFSGGGGGFGGGGASGGW